MNNVKQILKKNYYIHHILYNLYKPIKNIKLSKVYQKHYDKLFNDINKYKYNKKIFFIGIPIHNNLGDQAQYICIKKWLEKFYKDYKIIEIADCIVCHNYKNIIGVIKKQIKDEDFFVFQSGYRTTDVANIEGEYTHQQILNNFKNKVIVFPQTVNFKLKNEKKKSASAYNKNNNYIFLARDEISYKTALSLYNKERVLLYPDIVTTLIGNYNGIQNCNSREGILLCLRNDDEKLYTKEQYDNLITQLKSITDKIDITDTSSNKNFEYSRLGSEKELQNKLNQFAHYKLIITDRFHGTIFSLITSTPVIVLDSTDHKLSSGVNWFRDIYKDYVFYCNDIKNVYEFAKNAYKIEKQKIENAYFDDNYYKKLKNIINQINTNN